MAGAWSGHVGHQKVKNFNSDNRCVCGLNALPTLTGTIGVTKDVGFGVVAVKYSDTRCQGQLRCRVGEAYCWGTVNGYDYEAGKGKALVSFTKTF